MATVIAHGRSQIASVALIAAFAAVGMATPAHADEPTPTESPSANTAVNIETPGDWAIELLHRGGWPTSGGNVCAIVGWERQEGGQFVSGASAYNPLNTSQPMPGDSIFNSVGVRNYPDWNTGLDATVKTLNLGFYGSIRHALTDGKDPVAVLQAVSTSPWGTHADNPAGWLDGACQSWAAEFDAKRSVALEAVAAADQRIHTAEQKVAVAQEAQLRLDKRYATMAGQIAHAQADLNQFARSLYMQGMEPDAVTQVTAIESGDPTTFALVQTYAAYSGNKSANELQKSLDLLAIVADSRQKASESLNHANNELNEGLVALKTAQDELTKIEQVPAEF